MIGDSVVMCRLRAEIALAARSEIPVLVAGETGVGKELVACDLHDQSGRAGAFVPVNVCALSESMFDAAMFGHRRGAFTGAVGDNRGFFAEADGGTLFLDEICSLSLNAQAKILRAIDTRSFRPVGGRTDIASDFRLVTATNRSLRDEVAEGRFRTDLMYRLMGSEIEVPSLRARRGDIAPLFLHFLASFGSAVDSHRHIASDVWESILRYDWPGNVRELRHAAWHVATRSAGAICIEREHLSRHLTAGRPANTLATTIDEASADGESQALIRALLLHDWDTSAVARDLGVTRKTIYARMKRLHVPTRRTAMPAIAIDAGVDSRGEAPELDAGSAR